MSRPVFIVDELPAGAAPFELVGPEGRHAATVQRLRRGEALDLVDGRGGRATGIVGAVGRDRLVVELTEIRQEPPAVPRITVVQALPKGERGELAVQVLTEVGTDGVLPWQAARCVMRWQGERGERSRQRWSATAREAAKQSRRAWLPTVEPLATTAGVAARCAAVVAAGGGAYLLHEDATERLSRCLLPESGELMLIVGPEGGIADDENTALAAAGAVPVRLGPDVLRTSTAGAAAVALLSGRLGRW